MAPLMISVAGVRGIVGETLTPPVLARFAAAFGRLAPEGPIVVGGRDGPGERGVLVQAQGGRADLRCVVVERQDGDFDGLGVGQLAVGDLDLDLVNVIAVLVLRAFEVLLTGNDWSG